MQKKRKKDQQERGMERNIQDDGGLRTRHSRRVSRSVEMDRSVPVGLRAHTQQKEDQGERGNEQEWLACVLKEQKEDQAEHGNGQERSMTMVGLRAQTLQRAGAYSITLFASAAPMKSSNMAPTVSCSGPLSANA